MQELSGPWKVAFDPKWSGINKAIVFDRLDDWSKRPEEAVKHFSGTAVYRQLFELSDANHSDAKSTIQLDLGKVAIMATVILNGRNLGTLWKSPFKVDITNAIKPGKNALEIRVVNLLINRMIGDEFLPEDSERKTEHDSGELKDMKWPQWITEGKASPTGRYTFSTWRAWKKDDPLQESGLLGPVKILRAVTP